MAVKRKQIPVAIIGTGNIGSDLLTKIERSELLHCVLFSGKNADSAGLSRAREMGIRTSHESIQALLHDAQLFDIVFDATSAVQHQIHAPIFKKLKKFTIDMTPSKIGTLCVPVVNLSEGISSHNVSMISCGGQANIPVIHEVMKIHSDVSYVEVVSSISSRSAGIGTRDNIDEYTQTTTDAIRELTGVKNAKTIIILNPADPPVMMHNTVYIPYESPNIEKIITSVQGIIAKLKTYVPGFTLLHPPFYDQGRIVIMTQVVGLGDFLPMYAGNLDIINCAAIAVAEGYAKKNNNH